MFKIESQKTITVGAGKVVANYPKVGQKRQIEARKLLFSDGIYGEIARSAHITGEELLDSIDAYAYLSICCPSLGLAPELFEELDPLSERALVKAYKEEFKPWYNSIEEQLKSFDPTAKDKEDTEETEEDVEA